MARSVTFVPRTYASAEPGDLTYVERISRNRSIHVLLQETTQNRPASRRHFLLKSYREIVSRYLSMGRIEHPLPLLRHLIRHFDSFSKRVDCRVDDFRGLGFYVLVQDGNTFFLLTGREGRVAIRRGGRFTRLETGTVAGVRELPVELASAQKELFSNSLRDFLLLYRIEQDDGAPLVTVMGGAGAEIEAVIEALSDPTRMDSLPAEGNVEMAIVSHAVMYCAFDRAEPLRLPPLMVTDRRSRLTGGRRAAVMATAIAVAAMGAGATWVAQRATNDEVGEAVVQESGEVPGEAVALQESPPRLRPDETPDATSAPVSVTPGEDEAAEVHFALEWSQSRQRAITTTPLLDGDVVIYGSRDGRLYAVERDSGERKWEFDAGGGIGSSPVEAGRAVLFADYDGSVFSVDRASGRMNWKQTLPGKVVSTAVVGGGEVLVGCTDGRAYGLSLETGRVLWKLETADRIRGTPAWSDGRFFVPSYDGFLYAVSAGSGNVLWKHPVGASVSSSPAVHEEIVIVGSENRQIHGIECATGTRRWSFETSGPVRSFLRVHEGRVYAGCSDNFVYCLDARSGREIWRYATGGAVLSRPFVREGMVFVTSYDGNVYCLDAATGALRDRYATGGEVFSSPVADDTHVYFGNNTGRFYCVRYREEPAS